MTAETFGMSMIVVFSILLLTSLIKYRIVPPSEAHLVVTRNSKQVVSPDDEVALKINKKGKIIRGGVKTYFEIPSFIPFLGKVVRKMDVTIKEVVIQQETYEKNQGRYGVKSSTKYRIKNVMVAAETFIDDAELEKQLGEVIQSAVRAVTVKYHVTEARSEKRAMEDAIRTEMTDDLAAWGLQLVNFQLVNFADTADSSIISDISKRQEVDIAAQTRIQNAEKIKQARISEADADEKSQQREIARDRVVGEAEQSKKQMIATKEKDAEEERFTVIQVQITKQAEIDKEKAIIEAKQAKETELIHKERKQLEGQGDRLLNEEQAKGKAAFVREQYLAEAEGKEKLQAALNKFGDKAIRALVAEKVVDMQKEVGLKTAEALQYADVRLFAGGKGGEEGFNLSQMITAAQLGNEDVGASVLNKVARPNDLGLVTLGLKGLAENETKENPKMMDEEPIKEEERLNDKGNHEVEENTENEKILVSDTEYIRRKYKK